MSDPCVPFENPMLPLSYHPYLYMCYSQFCESTCTRCAIQLSIHVFGTVGFLFHLIKTDTSQNV